MKENSPVNKKVEVNLLSAFYAPLLTQHQQKVLMLSYEEDLSLGEIAQQLQVSRQGVHDILSRAIKQLYYFEEQLGMYQRFTTIQVSLNQVITILSSIETTKESKKKLEDAVNMIHQLLQEDEEEGSGF